MKMNRKNTTILTAVMTLFLACGQVDAQEPQADDKEILAHEATEAGIWKIAGITSDRGPKKWSK